MKPKASIRQIIGVILIIFGVISLITDWGLISTVVFFTFGVLAFVLPYLDEPELSEEDFEEDLNEVSIEHSFESVAEPAPEETDK